jgi:dTDP-4-amino-4,6-dideoxygalactose transaminase
VYHLYVVRLRGRDRAAVAGAMQSSGVQTGVHYPVPAHLTPAFRSLGYARGDFPVTERLASEVLSLPMYPGLSIRRAEAVVASLRAATRGRSS